MKLPFEHRSCHDALGCPGPGGLSNSKNHRTDSHGLELSQVAIPEPITVASVMKAFHYSSLDHVSSQSWRNILHARMSGMLRIIRYRKDSGLLGNLENRRDPGLSALPEHWKVCLHSKKSIMREIPDYQRI
ncbi:hypothetical protein H8959_005339 [Pygathrix nigripes]